MTLMQFFPYPLLNQGGWGIAIIFAYIVYLIVAVCLPILAEQLLFIDAKRSKRPLFPIAGSFKEEKPFRSAVFKESFMVILFPITGFLLSDSVAGAMPAVEAGTILALYILFRSKDAFAVVKRILIVFLVFGVFVLFVYVMSFSALLILFGLMAINAIVIDEGRVKRKVTKVLDVIDTKIDYSLSADASMIIAAVIIVALAFRISFYTRFGRPVGEILKEPAIGNIPEIVFWVIPILCLVYYAYRKINKSKKPK